MKSYDIIRCSTLIRGERASALCQLQTFPGGSAYLHCC